MKSVKDKIAEVDLALIDEPKGIVRMEIDPAVISELAQSISEIGLLQTILVRPIKERFEIVFGHRRFLAYKKLALDKIRAVIKVMTDSEAAIARATENLARENLSPIEEAATFKDLLDTHAMTYEQIGAKVGKSPGLVKRRMDLLKMPPQLQVAVHKKRIAISVAEELWPISDPTQLGYYLSFCLDQGCTTAVARQWCKDWKDAQRRESLDVEPGREPMSPQEPRPTFLTCDLCLGAVELGKDKIMRACPECYQQIMNAIKGV